jgi:uncharacterized protein
MERDIYSQLLAWKTAIDRKPLILMGARQVGKTHLLRSFGDREYQSSVYLNFEEDRALSGLFMPSLKPSVILENISAYLAQDIKPETTLVIFDEIQESSEALNSLKYFQEQANEYHIVAAGSLLGVHLAQTKGFPVGKVNFLDLYPLTFFEFLASIGESRLREILFNLDQSSSIPDVLHERLLILLKKYLFVGGMPEAVLEYIRTGNLLTVKKIQNDILRAYLLDFAKHAAKEQIVKINQVWEQIPAQLAKENKKFIFTALRKSARGREYETAIQWMANAGLIHRSFHVDTPKLPLVGYAQKNAFKIFLLDVGLLSAMSHIPPKSVVEDNKIFSEFYGAFTENFVAQELAAGKNALYYWTSEGIAEIDFLVEQDLNIYPLEVKAGLSRQKKSLVVYSAKYQPAVSVRASLRNLKKDGAILNIPLYLISQINNILDNKIK